MVVALDLIRIGSEGEMDFCMGGNPNTKQVFQLLFL